MTSTKSKAGLIGIRSALIGSLLFAVAEGITLVTTEFDSMTEGIRHMFSWMILIFCISTVLSIFPGYLGGRMLEWLRQKNRWDRRSLMILGSILGIIVVFLISLPNLLILLAHHYWGYDKVNSSAFILYVSRLIEVIIIAGLLGSWSGSQIAKS